MEPGFKVALKMNIPKVLKQSQARGKKLVDKYALQIEGQTKIFIVANGQIDTGFMLNSVYSILSSGASSYLLTWPSGSYGGQSRTKAPRGSLQGKAIAAVGVAASYALWQELKKSFLFAALESVAHTAGFTVEFK